MSLTIAIDFDDTFTAAPELWEKVIHYAQQMGHNVICVTSRRNTPENQELIERAFMQWHIIISVWFCDLESKLKEMNKRGIKVDIWIDDDPIGIVQGH